MLDWLLRVSALGSQAINMFVLGIFSYWIGLPHQNQTVSARCYENRNQHKFWNHAYRSINKIFWFQDDHCYRSFLNDQIWATELVKKMQEAELNNLKIENYKLED